MNIVLLNGARVGDTKVDEVSGVLQSILKDLGSVSAYRLKEIKVADCLGCFGCWIKTPGKCIIEDDAKELTKKVISADLKIFVTLLYSAVTHQN